MPLRYRCSSGCTLYAAKHKTTSVCVPVQIAFTHSVDLENSLSQYGRTGVQCSNEGLNRRCWSQSAENRKRKFRLIL